MRAVRQFRVVAFLEGSSFLALLFIAMPLKYLADLPLAVRIAGSVHGLLFLMFLAALYRAATERHWPLRRSLLAFVSSIVPFGTFILDRSLRREIASMVRSRSAAESGFDSERDPAVEPLPVRGSGNDAIGYDHGR